MSDRNVITTTVFIAEIMVGAFHRAAQGPNKPAHRHIGI